MSTEAPKFIRVGDNPDRSLLIPLINETAERLGIDGLHVEPYDLGISDVGQNISGHFYDQLADLDGLRGATVTMPLTTRILPEFISASSSRIDEKYLGLLGAVDTITADPGDVDRPWILQNSDAMAVKETFDDYGVALPDKNYLILGAGGAARAAAFAVAQQKPSNIVIANRNPDNADSLAQDLELVANRTSSSRNPDGMLRTGIQTVTLGDLEGDNPVPNWTLSSADIVINGTPIGQRGHSAEHKMPISPLQLVSQLRPGAVILDTVYDPARTPLVQTANPVGYGKIPFREEISAKKFVAIQGTQWALRKAMRQFVEFNNALVRYDESEPLTDKQTALARELMTEILAKEISLRTNQ